MTRSGGSVCRAGWLPKGRDERGVWGSKGAKTVLVEADWIMPFSLHPKGVFW